MTTKKNDEHRSSWWSLSLSNVLQLVFDFFLVAFTGGLWLSTHRMWKETKDTAEAARKSADALPAIERAYLFIDVELRQDERLQVWEVIIKIYNGGKTPATDIRACADVIEGTTCPIDIEETNRIRLTEGSIISAGTTHVEPVTGPRSWTIPDIEPLIKNVDGAFICYGRIDYKDVFNGGHFTKFCWHHGLQTAMREGVNFCRCENKEANRRT